jgi:hypothetical protein
MISFQVNFSTISNKSGFSRSKSFLVASSKSAKSKPGATVQLTKANPVKMRFIVAFEQIVNCSTHITLVAGTCCHDQIGPIRFPVKATLVMRNQL